MRRVLALIVVLALLAVGLYYWKNRPAGETPRQALGAVGDRLRAAKATGEIKAALELNRNLKPYPIDVDVTGDGVVTLKGAVPREDFKAEAKRVAAAGPGVRTVRDEIRVDPALPAPAPGDRAQTAKRALAANPSLAPYDIQVREEGGRLVLHGRVNTAAEKDLAGLVARDATGAQIDNALEVRL